MLGSTLLIPKAILNKRYDDMGMFGERSRVVVRGGKPVEEPQEVTQPLVMEQMEEVQQDLGQIAREDAQKMAAIQEAMGVTQSLRNPQEVMENLRKILGPQVFRTPPTIQQPSVTPEALPSTQPVQEPSVPTEAPAPVQDTQITQERPAELTQEEVLRPRARPEPEISSLRPRARPEGIQPITKPEVQNVIDILPTGLDESVQDKLEDSPPKTTGDVNLAIFDSATWDGTIPEIKKGENFIEYFARSGLIGADEKDPKFIEAYKNFGMGIDPSKTPWCADLLGSLILKSGGKLTEGAVQYRAGSQNYEFIGDDVYNHNPTTGETYFGSPSDVRAGDIVVFNNKQDGTRQKNGNFKYPSQALKKGLGLGHVSVVLDIKEDGTIIAIGGNQSAGATSYITGTESTGGIRVSEYTPEVMKNNYKGGFKIKRLTDTSLSQADPELIAAITKNAGIAGTGQ